MKQRIFDIELVKSIRQILPSNAFKKLKMLSAFQITTTIFDVVAIFLLGLLSKVGLEFIQGEREAIPLPYINFILWSEFKFEIQFGILSCVVLVLFLFRTLLAIWGNRKILNFLGSQSAYASKQIINELFKSKPQYVTSKNTQELLYGVTAGIDNLILFYLGSLAIIISELFFLTILILALLIFQPITGLCALIIFGGAGFFIHKMTSSSTKSDSAECGRISVNYSQQLLETIQLYREYYLRGSILEATSELQKLRDRYLGIRAKIMFLPMLSKYLFEFILIIGGAIVATLQFVISDANNAIASVIVFLGASSRILPSVIRLQSSLLLLKQAEGASQITLHQIHEIGINQIDIVKESSFGERIPSSLEFITVNELCFKYPDQERDTLNGLNFAIKKGQLVAIVGESGAGKSTLADLLLGIQEPSNGFINIAGRSPRVYKEEHPGALAYVPQDISVLEGSILKNVTLTNAEDSDLERVVESLKRAMLWNDLRNSTYGIHSMVGERGMKLSGGQKQRLGIARALYTNPSLIVFDEATSSLDPKTEKSLTDAVYLNHGEVTLVVIAHRLSTVKKADQVLLLEKGELVASGTFDEVRAKSANFDEQAKLVNL